MSALITIYSIYAIFKTTKQLSTTNDNVKINKQTFYIHSALLIVSSLASIAYTIPFSKFQNFSRKVEVMQPIADVLV